MQNRVFRVCFGADDEGCWVDFGGDRAGPFRDDLAAEHHVLGIFARWRVRAQALGGQVLRRTREEILVTLPDDVVIRGGEPLTATVRSSP